MERMFVMRLRIMRRLIKGGDNMRDEYNIKELNPRKNPYSQKMKKAITMNVNVNTLDYFKNLSDQSGIPYQTLMNCYLDECVREKKKLMFV